MLEYFALTLCIAVGILMATVVMIIAFMSPFVMGWYIKKSMEMTKKITEHMFKEEETN